MRKRTAIVLILLITLLASCTSGKMNDPSKEQLVDVTWVISPEFEGASPFFSAIARVEDSRGNLKYIDKSAMNIYDKEFIQITSSHNGFTASLPVVSEVGGTDSYVMNITGRELSIQNDKVIGADIKWPTGISAARTSDNKYGIVNSIGQWIVEPVFSSACIWPRGTISVSGGFLTDRLEYVALPAGYEIVGPFEGGIALVMKKAEITEQYYNFSNEQGELLLEKDIHYDANVDGYGFPTIEDGYIVYRENGVYGIMDFEGDALFKPQFQEKPWIKNGTIHLLERGVYLDFGGNEIALPKKAEYIEDFENGMAAAGITDKNGELVGVLSEDGEWIIKPEYDICSYRAEMNVWECTKITKEGRTTDVFLVATGKWEKGYEDVRAVSPTAFVGTIAEHDYLVDVSGEKAVHYKFDYIGSSSEGLMVACKNDLCGYIDTQGNLILDFRFENARAFSEGVAAVQVDGKWGYIANPLVYSEWSADEVTRAQLLGIVPDGAPDETITVQEFLELLCSALDLEEATLQDADVDFSQQLTRKAAATLIARAAEEKGCYYRYFLPDCDDASEVSEDNKFQAGFSIQSGIIKLQSYRFNEDAAVSGEETYQILLRTYEYCL